MAAKRITLAMVAQRAGVNPATVSQVLNKRANCWASAETRERIVAAANDLGYRPNLAARSLRSGSTQTIGLVVTGLAIGSSHNRINGLEQAASKHGYVVMMSFNANSPETEDRLIRQHLDRGVDGLVVYPTDSGEHLELQRLIKQGFPLVTYDGAGRLDFRCDDVSPDFAQVGRLQAEHLTSLGKRRLVLLSPAPVARINQLRDIGLHTYLANHCPEAELVEVTIQNPDSEWPDAQSQYGQVLDWVRTHKGQFDALIGYDSITSLGLRACLEAGLRVPQDVAVIGAGESILASCGVFPISSITTHDDWIGQQAFGLLQSRLKGSIPDGSYRQIVSTPELIARHSTVGAGQPSV